MKVVIVTGTPGTGKTTLARRLARLTGYAYIDVNKVIVSEQLSEGYDRKRKCKIIDTRKLNNALKKIIRSEEKEGDHGVIIDSHMSHLMPVKSTSICIVTTCDLKKLDARLKKRGYNKEKIKENLECEIMEVCLSDAAAKGHETYPVDCSAKKVDYDKIIRKIKRIKNI